MAEDKDESQEKTQEPSSRKIQKAEEEGKVVTSKEMGVFVVLAAGVILMYITPFFVTDFLEILKDFFRFGIELKSGHSPLESIKKAISLIVKVVLVFGVPLAIVCIISQLLIGGINFSLKAVHWKISKCNPISGIKKIISIKGLVDLGKSILKVLVLGGISFFVIKQNIPEITYLTTTNLTSAIAKIVSFFPEVIIGLLLGLALIAAIDIAWQKYDYIKSLRMSHQDIKDEYKETDGQPEVKQKIRKLQMQAASKSAAENASVDNLSEATAIITNPTHFAIALKYKVGQSEAPLIIAKGKGKVAERIIEKGKKLRIGSMQSPILARAIYYTGEIGEEVIGKLYSAVAVALAYIYKLDNGENIEKPQVDVPSELIFDEFGNNENEDESRDV